MNRMEHRSVQASLILICMACFFIASGVFAAQGSGLSDSSGSADVIKEIKPSDSPYIEKTGRYVIRKDDCAVCWEVSVDRGMEKRITLRSFQPLGVECTAPFPEQVPLHRRIFSEMFKDWEKDRFHTLFTGPFDRLAPAHTWNVRMAAASADSSDWADWSKNYPNHSSGKSVNQIFVELANQADVARELSGLFEEFGLNIEMTAVEKVFDGRVKNLEFHPELRSRGLKGNQRVIFDAGMMYFSISPQN